MAIFHLSMQIASRNGGKRSLIAMASYRSGERLYSELYEKTNHYQEREIQPDSFILKPNHVPNEFLNSEYLWNKLELAETSPNAQLCREINVALPIELNNDEQKEFNQILAFVIISESRLLYWEFIGNTIVILGSKIIKFLMPSLFVLRYFSGAIDKLLGELENGLLINNDFVYRVLSVSFYLMFSRGIIAILIYYFFYRFFKHKDNKYLNFSHVYFIDTIDFILNIVFTCATVFFISLTTINTDMVRFQNGFIPNADLDTIKLSLTLFTLYYLPLKLMILIIKYVSDYIL